MVTPYDASQLPLQKLRWRADSFSAFNAADFANLNTQYLQCNVPAAWNGASKFTIGGYALLNPHVSLGNNLTICGASNAAGTQMMLFVGRNGSNFLNVGIARSLTDTSAYATGSQLICGNNEQAGTIWGGQGWVPLLISYDGGRTGNDRLRLYVRGVRDTNVNYGGATVPATLTSPTTAVFQVGHDSFQGGAFRGSMFNLFAMAGYAATDTDALALANLTASGYPLPWTFAALPAGAPALSNFTNGWLLGESSTGASAVSRADSVGSATLTDGLGGTNVPSVALGTVTDLSGNNNSGSSMSHIGAEARACIAPQTVANDLNGHPSLHFSTAVNTPCSLRFGQLGGSNPDAYTIVEVLNYDFNDATHEMTAHGSDRNASGTAQNATFEVFCEEDNNDFTIAGGLASIIGSGTAIDAFITGANPITTGTAFILTTRHVPGGPVEKWINKTKQTLTEIGTIPAWQPGGINGTNYTPVTHAGGNLYEWCCAGSGNVDQSSASPAACWMGKQPEFVFCFTNLSDAQVVQEQTRLGLYYGISAAVTTPAAPTGLAASFGPTLNWAASPTVGVNGYNVYRGLTPGGETLYSSSATNAFTDNSVTSGVTYYYKVTAVIFTTAGNAESAQSAEVSGTGPISVTDTRRIWNEDARAAVPLVWQP